MGFFFADTDVVPTKRARPTIPPGYFERLGCKACPLDKIKLRSPKMPPTGSDTPDLLIIGEAAGRVEDEEGVQFVGKSGQFLRERIPRRYLGVIRWNNAIRCRPPDNRTPEEIELRCCVPKQLSDIEATRPKVVLALGATPLKALTGQPSIASMRGRAMALRVGKHSAWLVPSYHPAFLLRLIDDDERKFKDFEDLFLRDLDLAFSLIKEPPPVTFDPAHYRDGVVLAKDVATIQDMLEFYATEAEITATDLETVNLRPYERTSKILTVSVSDGDSTLAFPLDHPEHVWEPSDKKRVETAYLAYLRRARQVFAHNCGFEAEFLLHRYGLDLAYSVNWHDTMAMAYVLDERQNCLSLDDVTSIYLGFHLKALSDVDVKNILTCRLDDLLTYNSLDAKFTVQAAVAMRKLLKRDKLLTVYEMHRARPPVLAATQILGMHVDFAKVEEVHTRYDAKIKGIETKIVSHPQIKAYQARYPAKFNPGSTKDLGTYLADFCGYQQCRGGRSGYRTGEEVLKDLDDPIAKLVLELREVSKAQSTYITPLRKGGSQIHSDDMIHPNFNAFFTTTGRLSADRPNVQNQPKRRGENIRFIFNAPEGCFVVSFDYGQIEARVIAMASEDQLLSDAMFTDYDIHMDEARAIAHAFPEVIGGRDNLEDEKAMKAFRAKVKNQWTFPLFYKASLNSVARSFDLTPEDLRPLYNQFWGRFRGVRAWQKRLIKSAHELGYVACLTGRRRRLPMTENMMVNTPIQGTAADIVVEAMTRLSRYALTRDRLDLHPRLNVHDDLTFYLRDATFEDDVPLIAKVMCTVDFPFVTVPLTVEVNAGVNWGEQEEVAKYKTTDFV